MNSPPRLPKPDLLERICALFPEAVLEHDGSLRIRGEEGVLISLYGGGIRIALSCIVPDGARTSYLGAEPWCDFAAAADFDDATLRKHVEAGLAARAAEYRPCIRCNDRVPPERRIHNDTCHPCAERWDGAVT